MSVRFVSLVKLYVVTGRPIGAVSLARFLVVCLLWAATTDVLAQEELCPWVSVAESYGDEMVADNKTIPEMVQAYALEGRLPVDRSRELFQPTFSTRRADLSDSPWAQRECWWAASEFWHCPVYFDDVPLESYGQTSCRLLQPALSGVHFFGDILLLPYSMIAAPPLRHVSQLGEYRPGSCAPSVREGLRCVR